MADEKKMSDETILAIRAQKGKKSSRALARMFGVSRSEVEKVLSSSGRPSERAAAPATARPLAFYAMLVFAAAVLAFSSSLGNGFVWDDRQMIVQDPTIGDWSRLGDALSKPLGHFGEQNPKGALWRPLETLTLFVDATVWGKRPFGFHLTNVLLHGAVSAAFFLLLVRVFGVGLFTLAAAVWYAVHPAHAESVAYIPSRGEVLSGLFILSAILNYRKRAVWSFLSFAAAVISKETSLMLPALLPVYDVYVRREKDFSLGALVKRYGPYVLLAAAYLALRVGLLGGMGSASEGGEASALASWTNRLWIQPVNFFEYMKMIFWPAGLHTWRQVYFPSDFFEPRYFWPFTTFVLFLALVFRALKKGREGFFGAFWFGAFLFPVMNLAVIVNSPVLEHWLYMPLMGLVIFILSAIGRERLERAASGWWAKPAVWGIAAVLGAVTFAQCMTWKNEITLFEHTTRYVTRDPLLYNNLGTAYAEKGDLEKAEQAFRRALAVDPQYGSAVHNLEKLMRQKGKT